MKIMHSLLERVSSELEMMCFMPKKEEKKVLLTHLT